MIALQIVIGLIAFLILVGAISAINADEMKQGLISLIFTAVLILVAINI